MIEQLPGEEIQFDWVGEGGGDLATLLNQMVERALVSTSCGQMPPVDEKCRPGIFASISMGAVPSPHGS